MMPVITLRQLLSQCKYIDARSLAQFKCLFGESVVVTPHVLDPLARLLPWCPMAEHLLSPEGAAEFDRAYVATSARMYGTTAARAASFVHRCANDAARGAYRVARAAAKARIAAGADYATVQAGFAVFKTAYDDAVGRSFVTFNRSIDAERAECSLALARAFAQCYINDHHAGRACDFTGES
jgi:hypothetical protein